MRIAIGNVRLLNNRSLVCLVSVELLDLGLTVRNVGIHRGRDGRVWVDLPSRPIEDESGKHRVPHLYFNHKVTPVFHQAVLDEAVRLGIIPSESFITTTQTATKEEGIHYGNEHLQQARQ